MKVELTLEQLRTILDALDNSMDGIPLDAPSDCWIWCRDRILSSRKVVNAALRECAVIERENR